MALWEDSDLICSQVVCFDNAMREIGRDSNSTPATDQPWPLRLQKTDLTSPRPI